MLKFTKFKKDQSPTKRDRVVVRFMLEKNYRFAKTPRIHYEIHASGEGEGVLIRTHKEKDDAGKMVMRQRKLEFYFEKL